MKWQQSVERLELKVPPVVVGGIVALLMWGAARLWPSLTLPLPPMFGWGVGCGVLGVLVALAGVLSFRRAHTTVNPMQPGDASSLVVSGIYRFSRNPMYLGMALVLLGWAFHLAHPVSLAMLALFVGYMNRFQIVPEERAMQQLFGEQFDLYRRRVRRWL
ncbi:methyltransferase family protein [Marinobacterium arenosum]|uniref:methyltransferase family protein n=1 Tax=Marinobacterium arenosum TaxID=2862496 RepID=UPI001C9586FB|nr:isoprenylcysteine carboxylmethyltransferase family protein [Marinobacterium arenosum]MBY4678428.1 isoprenylcysteine carboxylmethyltransferase family protein [Marinobacterium arenosum]